MRMTIQAIVLALSMLFILPCQAQTADQIFPKGELSTVKNHSGNIWLKELVAGNATFDPGVAVATYDVAGCRPSQSNNRLPSPLLPPAQKQHRREQPETKQRSRGRLGNRGRSSGK